MGVQRTTFEKLQRERNKKAKAAAKRARREEKASGDIDVTEAPPLDDDDGLGELTAGELLQRVEQIHQRFEAKLMSFEEFEAAKEQLLSRITVD